MLPIPPLSHFVEFLPKGKGVEHFRANYLPPDEPLMTLSFTDRDGSILTFIRSSRGLYAVEEGEFATRLYCFPSKECFESEIKNEMYWFETQRPRRDY